MNRSLPFALVAAGLFLAAPAFAQTAAPQNPPKKQQTQEGAPATPQTSSDYKQRTQEGAPVTPQSSADYKHK
jgi:hypothetical protein